MKDSIYIGTPFEPPFVPTGVLTGHDALAESFGDAVYCRRRGGLVECPSCGRWEPVDEGLGATCLLPFTEVESTSWFTVELAAVLAHDSEHFFFPRRWNSYRTWITKNALRQQHEQFNKERETYVP